MTSTFTIRLSGPEKHAILKAAGRSNASAWARSILLEHARPKERTVLDVIEENKRKYPKQHTKEEMLEAWEGMRR